MQIRFLFIFHISGRNSMIQNENKLLFKIKDKEYIGSCVSVGNPHTVIILDSLDNIDIEKIGPIIENYKYFPQKTNVEFVKIINRKQLKIKVWERGVRKYVRVWKWGMCCFCSVL